jgi:hypothetical protein
MMLLPSCGRAKWKVDAIAARTGLATSTLYQYIEGLRDLPVRQVPLLTQAADDTLLIEALAEACGGMYLPLPGGEDIGTGSLVRVIRLFSQLCDGAANAIEDGQITPEELRQVERRGTLAIQAVRRLLNELCARANQGKGAAL